MLIVVDQQTHYERSPEITVEHGPICITAPETLHYERSLEIPVAPAAGIEKLPLGTPVWYSFELRAETGCPIVDARCVCAQVKAPNYDDDGVTHYLPCVSTGAATSRRSSISMRSRILISSIDLRFLDGSSPYETELRSGIEQRRIVGRMGDHRSGRSLVGQGLRDLMSPCEPSRHEFAGEKF
jgi:hypothetical protein